MRLMCVHGLCAWPVCMTQLAALVPYNDLCDKHAWHNLLMLTVEIRDTGPVGHRPPGMRALSVS